jgi:phenylpropionate dioxygenase-like ring-hydroxylating dioxygenase large terminal subunit
LQPTYHPYHIFHEPGSRTLQATFGTRRGQVLAWPTRYHYPLAWWTRQHTFKVRLRDKFDVLWQLESSCPCHRVHEMGKALLQLHEPVADECMRDWVIVNIPVLVDTDPVAQKHL